MVLVDYVRSGQSFVAPVRPWCQEVSRRASVSSDLDGLFRSRRTVAPFSKNGPVFPDNILVGSIDQGGPLSQQGAQAGQLIWTPAKCEALVCVRLEGYDETEILKSWEGFQEKFV